MRRAVLSAVSCAALPAACASQIRSFTRWRRCRACRGRRAKVVVLREIGLARYLERSQIVRSSENYQLDVRLMIGGANRWAR